MTTAPRLSSLLILPFLCTAPSLQAEDAPITFSPLWDVTWKDSHQWVEAVSRRRQSIFTAPQAVVVLNEEDLQNTPAPDIAQRLRYEAGIDVYQSRHGQIDIGIRGFAGLNSPRTVAMIDGREFNFDLFGTPLWVGALHPTDIIRAEIVKGPSSVTYGANAFGGVIALKDRDVGDFAELHTLAQVGNHGLFELDATAMGPLGQYNGPGPMYFKISAGSTRRDDFDGLRGFDPGTSFPRARQNDDENTVSDRAQMILGTKLAHDHFIEFEFYRLDIDKWDMIEDLAVGSNDMDIEQTTVGVRLIGPWGEARYLHTDTNEFYSNQITTYNPAADYRYTQGDLNTKQDQFRFQYNKEAGAHFISTGIDYLRWESLSNFWNKDALITDPNSFTTVTTHNRAAFIEDQWQPNDTWTLTNALRVDNHNIVGTNVSPRVAANYKINDDQFMRLSYSSGYRLPSPLEGYLDQYFYDVSEDLEEETIQSVNLGWQTTWNEKKSHLSVDIFYNRSQDTPFFVPIDETEIENNWNDWLAAADPTRAPGPFFIYENIDNPATVYGIELSSEHAFHDEVGKKSNIWLNVTYQNFSFEDDIIYQSDGFDSNPGPPVAILGQFNQNLGDDINGPPDWKASLGANMDRRGWHFSGALRFVSSREVFAFASSQWLTRDQASRDRLDANTFLDLAVGYNWGYESDLNRSLKLSIMDVFDNEHTEIYEVTVAELQDSGENQHTNEVGRTVVLSFNWEF